MCLAVRKLTHLNVFQSTGMHFISVAFIRAMLTCELNIRTQCRILYITTKRKQKKKKKNEKGKGKSNRSTDIWNIYPVTNVFCRHAKAVRYKFSNSNLDIYFRRICVHVQGAQASP